MLPNSILITKPPEMTPYDWRHNWLNLRVGLFTASKANKLASTSKRKTNGATVLENYVLDVVQEMVEGRIDGFTNDTMENGNIFEDDAMNLFMEKNNKLIQRLTFLKVGDHCGISADGIDIDGDFGCEVKSPHFKGFANYCKNIDKGLEVFKKTYEAHYAQMQMAMWGYEYDHYYFITYYAPEYQKKGAKAHYKQMVIKRDEEYIKRLSDGVDKAIGFKKELLSSIS